jgi:hypothetical protein
MRRRAGRHRLVQAVIGLPYYWDRWPAFGQASRRRIAAVLDDVA